MVIKLTSDNKQVVVLTLGLSKEQPPNINAIFPAIVRACPCLRRNMEQWQITLVAVITVLFFTAQKGVLLLA